MSDQVTPEIINTFITNPDMTFTAHVNMTTPDASGQPHSVVQSEISRVLPGITSDGVPITVYQTFTDNSVLNSHVLVSNSDEVTTVPELGLTLTTDAHMVSNAQTYNYVVQDTLNGQPLPVVHFNSNAA